MSTVDPFKEIEELAARAERQQEQLDKLTTELAEKREALQARLDSIAPTNRRVSPMRKRGENLEAVRKAIAEGVTDLAKLAERVGITKSAVKKYLDQIKDEGGGEDDDSEPEVAPPPRAPVPRPNLEGDSVDQIRKEILRHGGKARLLVTGGADGHKHVAEVDSDGAGITTAAGKDRHFHVIRDFVPRANAGAGPSVHRHELTKVTADS